MQTATNGYTAVQNRALKCGVVSYSGENFLRLGRHSRKPTFRGVVEQLLRVFQCTN